VESSATQPGSLKPRWIVAAAGSCALIVGLLTLLGYALDVRRLTDWGGDGISMFPNAAACAALSGLALLLLPATERRKSWRIVLRLIVSLVGLVGGGTLLEHLTGVNLGIDTLLYERTWGQAAAMAPMRMGPPASTSYLIIGTGLLLTTYGSHARRFAGALAIGIVGIASLSLVGYWFGADHLFGVARFTGIAFQTSLVLAVIGIGLIASLPEYGVAALLRRDDPGGVIVRRLLLPIIVAPLVLGWLRVMGQEAGYFDTAFGTALLALVMIAMLLVLLWWTAEGVTRQVRLTRAAEEGVRNSEARHRALIEASVYGVLTIDERGIIESANPAAERLFGYAGSEMIGHNISMLMAEPYKAEHDSYLLNYFHTGVRKIIGIGREVEGRRKDGSTFPMDLAVAEFQIDGKRYYQGTVSDISQRRAAEEALRQKEHNARLLQEALKEADRRKDEFLATLAHELRNPLAPVLNALQILNMKGPPTPELQWARGVIDRQMQQMTRLIDDLMDVSRISRGKVELKREKVALANVIHGAVETSRPLIEQCGHELEVVLPPQTFYLDADLIRLAQVFSNLLNNAAKYTERGGRVWLTAEREGSDVVVSVKDTGIGIPADKLQSVFDIFSQVHGTFQQSHGGLGIGLSLAKQLVEMHGGTIDARSEGPGRGSEFVVRLPVVVERVPASTTSKEKRILASSFRILIVDDNRDAADSLGMMLRFMGNDIRTAYDGEEAVRAAEEFRPQVMLLDIGMPKLSGYDACRSIREQPWGKSMVLIAVTGWGNEEDKRKAKDAGFDRHMVKPAAPDELMQLLASLHEQSQGSSIA
jgi:PAS domain S-box-containing protein